MTEEQARAFLKKITAPVLLIEAEKAQKDQWTDLLLKRIPYTKTLRHLVIAGEHHLHLDDPEPVAVAIREFISDFSV